MIDTGKTLELLINSILQRNPKINVFVFCSHAIFSQMPTFLDNEQVKLVFTTNSLNNSNLKPDKVIVESLENTIVKFFKIWKNYKINSLILQWFRKTVYWEYLFVLWILILKINRNLERSGECYSLSTPVNFESLSLWR